MIRTLKKGAGLKISLDLSKHCIETELRRQHEKAISAYFKAGKDQKPKLEKTIEMIGQALETLDFSHLRSQYPALAGGTHQKVVLSKVDANLVIAIDDKKIGRAF